MLLLGLDLETTGLDVGASEIIEIGAVLWDSQRKIPLKILSELIQCKNAVPEEITAITGIHDKDVRLWGISLQEGLRRLHDLAIAADHIVAHNGINFDRLFLEREWVNFPETRFHKTWIDTSTDVPFGTEVGTRKLSYLAADHGFLNPFSHRAAFDVLTMLNILSRYDLNDVMRLQKSPLRRVIAQVSYEQRERAKGEGFRWDPQARHWYLEAKECLLEGRQFPFDIVWQ